MFKKVRSIRSKWRPKIRKKKNDVPRNETSGASAFREETRDTAEIDREHMEYEVKLRTMRDELTSKHKEQIEGMKKREASNTMRVNTKLAWVTKQRDEMEAKLYHVEKKYKNLKKKLSALEEESSSSGFETATNESTTTRDNPRRSFPRNDRTMGNSQVTRSESEMESDIRFLKTWCHDTNVVLNGVKQSMVDTKDALLKMNLNLQNFLMLNDLNIAPRINEERMLETLGKETNDNLQHGIDIEVEGVVPRKCTSVNTKEKTEKQVKTDTNVNNAGRLAVMETEKAEGIPNVVQAEIHPSLVVTNYDNTDGSQAEKPNIVITEISNLKPKHPKKVMVLDGSMDSVTIRLDSPVHSDSEINETVEASFEFHDSPSIDLTSVVEDGYVSRYDDEERLSSGAVVDMRELAAEVTKQLQVPLVYFLKRYEQLSQDKTYSTWQKNDYISNWKDGDEFVPPQTESNVPVPLDDTPARVDALAQVNHLENNMPQGKSVYPNKVRTKSIKVGTDDYSGNTKRYQYDETVRTKTSTGQCSKCLKSEIFTVNSCGNNNVGNYTAIELNKSHVMEYNYHSCTDHVLRHVVRSSPMIANLRDLKPCEQLGN